MREIFCLKISIVNRSSVLEHFVYILFVVLAALRTTENTFKFTFFKFLFNRKNFFYRFINLVNLTSKQLYTYKSVSKLLFYLI